MVERAFPGADETGGSTPTKVGKSDCEATFAGASGNDEDAPIPVLRRTLINRNVRP